MHAEILTSLNFYEVTVEKGSAIVKIVIKYIQQTSSGKMWGFRFCLGYQIIEIEKTHLSALEIVFCYHNCSYLLREKFVIV